MSKMHDMKQIQPQQNNLHKSLFSRQEVLKTTSSINEVQTKHRLLIWQKLTNTSRVGMEQKSKTQKQNHHVL
jgi:hypothetical protein